ncbi:hypothetical protein D3C81_1971920 [compost metagenome]
MINIFITLICIACSWWALQELHFDKIVKKPKSVQSKVLQILVSVGLGYQVARFFIDYFNWSTWLSGMF